MEASLENTTAREERDSLKTETRLIPVVDWPKYHPWPPIGGLRHLAFFAEEKGFAKAFIKVGRRLLVDETEFFRAVRASNVTTNNEGF